MQGDAAERRGLKQTVFLVYFGSWRCTLWEVMGTRCAGFWESSSLGSRQACPFLLLSLPPSLTVVSPLLCLFLSTNRNRITFEQRTILGLLGKCWGSFRNIGSCLVEPLFPSLTRNPWSQGSALCGRTSVSSFLTSLASMGWGRKDDQCTNLLTSGGCFQLSGPALRTESTTSLSTDPRKPVFPQYNLLHRRIPQYNLFALC